MLVAGNSGVVDGFVCRGKIVWNGNGQGRKHGGCFMKCKRPLISSYELHPEFLLFCKELTEALHEFAIFDGARIALSWLMAGGRLQGAIENGDILLVGGDELIRGLHPEMGLGILGFLGIRVDE